MASQLRRLASLATRPEPMRDATRQASTNDMLAATVHELRLPLSHIKGFVTSLRRTDVEWDDETRTEFLAEIELEADRLAELIDALLSGRASAKPATDLQFTHPAAVVEGALHRVRGLLAHRQLRLDIRPGLPTVRMDGSRMERVLANLIQNALKYSPPGTAIAVAAGLTDDCELELSVDDKGPGIPTQDRERIFEPFFRGDSVRQSRVPGHGLGLAICQSIVLAHGGRIQVANAPGGGARFSVFLPTQVHPDGLLATSQPKERGHDSAKHPCCGRRGANAQAPLQQSEGERLRGPVGSGRNRGIEANGGTPVRPAAA